MTVQLSELLERLKLRVKAFNSSFTDDELALFVEEAVETFSEYRPAKAQESFAFTAGVQSYPWPTGVLSVESALYASDEDYSLGWASVDWESPASVVRSEIYREKMAELTLSRLEADPTDRTFSLHPVPMMSGTGIISVLRQHLKSDDGMSYPTLNKADMRPIVDYAEAKCLESVASAFAAKNRKLGDRDNRGVDTAETLLKKAEKLMKAFRAELHTPFAARS